MRLFSEFERIVVRGMHVHTRSRRLHVAAHHVQAVADHGARQPVPRHRHRGQHRPRIARRVVGLQRAKVAIIWLS